MEHAIHSSVVAAGFSSPRKSLVGGAGLYEIDPGDCMVRVMSVKRIS